MDALLEQDIPQLIAEVEDAYAALHHGRGHGQAPSTTSKCVRAWAWRWGLDPRPVCPIAPHHPWSIHTHRVTLPGSPCKAKFPSSSATTTTLHPLTHALGTALAGGRKALAPLLLLLLLLAVVAAALGAAFVLLRSGGAGAALEEEGRWE